MPRKTKVKKEVKEQTVRESDVASLAVTMVEVYKNKCKNHLVASEDLSDNQKRELANALDNNEKVIKVAIMDQVALLFKG